MNLYVELRLHVLLFSLFNFKKKKSCWVSLFFFFVCVQPSCGLQKDRRRALILRECFLGGTPFFPLACVSESFTCIKMLLYALMCITRTACRHF